MYGSLVWKRYVACSVSVLLCGVRFASGFLGPLWQSPSPRSGCTVCTLYFILFWSKHTRFVPLEVLIYTTPESAGLNTAHRRTTRLFIHHSLFPSTSAFPIDMSRHSSTPYHSSFYHPLKGNPQPTPRWVGSYHPSQLIGIATHFSFEYFHHTSSICHLTLLYPFDVMNFDWYALEHAKSFQDWK